MSIQPYQQRVVDEQVELDIKLSALSKFLDTPMYSGINSDEQKLLTRQMYHMERYSQALHDRIEAF